MDCWEENFRLVKAYSDEHHGLLNMPDDYAVNGVRLNKWLNEQKIIGEGRRKKKLTPEQRVKLESVGLVFGKTKSDAVWQSRFAEAKKYYDLHGDLNVPIDTEKNLHDWLQRQRKQYKLGKLSENKARLLSQIGFDFGNSSVSELQFNEKRAADDIRKHI